MCGCSDEQDVAFNDLCLPWFSRDIVGGLEVNQEELKTVEPYGSQKP